jgi:hypothetical protein
MNEQQIILYNTPDGKSKITLMARDGSVWLNQQQLSELFATSKQNIGQHISSILKENELDKNSVIKNYFTTASDGKQYSVLFYSLEMILAIGFRVRSTRGTQFRQWANRNLTEFLIKGFVMDDERLKNPNTLPDYFDELLARIRDIRASEKRFYQKVRDLFALSSDYDKSDKATQMFYAETQNKLLFAITGETAAEIIVKRAKSDIPNMGLNTWKGSIVRKQDITIAKNYLTEDELDNLNRLVVIFLETAEFRAKNKQNLSMDFWRQNVDNILASNGLNVLNAKGAIGNKQMESIVEKIYEEFDTQRKQTEAKQADEQDFMELKELERKIKERK